MEHDWESFIYSGIGSQIQVRVIFKGSSLKSTVRHPSLSNLVIIFICFDEGHIFINSVKII